MVGDLTTGDVVGEDVIGEFVGDVVSVVVGGGPVVMVLESGVDLVVVVGSF